jgi:hypothetical protein
METKDAEAIISNCELLKLLQEARQRRKDSMLRLIDVFKNDMAQAGKYAMMPREDAEAGILVEFLEYICSMRLD